LKPRFFLLLISLVLSLPLLAQVDPDDDYYYSGATDTIKAETAKDTVKKVVPPEDKKMLSDRVFSGGNFGLQLGQYTIVHLAPLIGLKLTERITVGAGGILTIFRDNRSDYTSTIYGARAFQRFYVYGNQIYTHVEGEVLNGEWLPAQRFEIYNVLAGLGYQQLISDRVYFDITVMGNILPSEYSPYSIPVVRGGIIFNF
jgi:hypothetical protein